jgi:isoprenylcysteine carboxyl methyltransferase (ICMT) family protein YpbQ
LASQRALDRVSLREYGPEGWLWYPWCVALCVLTRYSSPRPDLLGDGLFWRRHGVFYTTQWAAWLALILVPVATACPEHCTDSGSVVALMVLAWFFSYPVSWGVLHQRRRFMSLFGSRATGLQAWVALLWFGWWMQGIAYVAISFLPFDAGLVDEAVYDHPLLIALAVLLAVAGSGIKMYCVYLSGLNNYYYYDMMLATPNARFVDSGLYKWFGSPTYHLGYIDGYGFALLTGALRRGSPMLALLFTLICHITITVVNELVEQPAVRAMYPSAPAPQEDKAPFGKSSSSTGSSSSEASAAQPHLDSLV